MTTASPFDNNDDVNELRVRWLNRYLKAQRPVDAKVKAALTLAAEDAYKRLISETSKSTFSASVKSAQIRLTLAEIKKVLHELFGEVKPFIADGQRTAAGYAFDAFTDTDREFLARAFLERSNLLNPGRNEKDARRLLVGYIKSSRLESQNRVQHAIQSVVKTDLPLSGRVYQAEKLSTGWVKNQVVSVIARSGDPREIAKTVKSSIRPDVPGGVSYAAMRLARTEVNNAFHATSISIAEDRPWIESMRWNLSKTHDSKSECICQRFADQIFTVSSVPSKPHPQCRCFVTPEVEAWDSFLRHLTAGQYRSWLSDAA